MSSNANFPESQSKAELQRQYREKEGEGFTELQLAMREVTRGKIELVKRHETLTKAAQKIRELHRQNDELRRQLNMILDPSQGAPGGQAPSAWPGGATANPYAPDFGPSAWANDFSAAQYSAQDYPDNAALSDSNLPQGYTGQGRGM